MFFYWPQGTRAEGGGQGNGVGEEEDWGGEVPYPSPTSRLPALPVHFISRSVSLVPRFPFYFLVTSWIYRHHRVCHRLSFANLDPRLSFFSRLKLCGALHYTLRSAKEKAQKKFPTVVSMAKTIQERWQVYKVYNSGYTKEETIFKNSPCRHQ